MISYSLEQLRNLPISHTDAGDFLFANGMPQKEFLLKGIITKERAGLFFITIGDDRFTAHKQEGFSVHEEITCIIVPQIDDSTVTFIIRSLEKA